MGLLVLVAVLALAGWWLAGHLPTTVAQTTADAPIHEEAATDPATPATPVTSASAPPGTSTSADAAAVAAAPAVDAVDPLLQTDVASGEALRLLQWCGGLAGPDPTQHFEQQWQWLGADAAAIERKTFVDARAWAIERCGEWALVPEGDRAKALKAQLIERARESTDIQDRLRALAATSGSINIDGAQAIEMRRLLEQALLAGRPELLGDIGRVLNNSLVARADLLGPYAGYGAVSLFSLLGCDLGAPCGRDSDVLRRNCAVAGYCSYPDYESMLFDAFHGARERELIQAHREELLRRIRAGEVVGLFDPLPLPPNPL
jgi:hypothetical protein